MVHGLKCTQCGKLIGKGHITSNEKNYHKDCYERYIAPRCSVCNSMLNGRYIEYKNKKYHRQCYEKTIAPRCSLCSELINNEYITTDGETYHNACYENHIAPRCSICNGIIDGEYNVENNKNYHVHCYEEHIALKCSICNEAINDKYTTDYWGNDYHSYHKDEYPKCEYCGRLICSTLSGGGHEYPDGRCVCGLCFSTAVYEDEYSEKLLQRTLSLLNNYQINLCSSNFDLDLIDKRGLAQLMGRKYNSKTHGTMHYEEETVNGILKKQTFKVYVLSGLPCTRFMSVLTHELIHVYSKLFFKDFSQRVEEGIAVLFSYLILKEINDKEAEYLIKCLEDNIDPVYGDSFRRERRKLDKIGFKNYMREKYK